MKGDLFVCDRCGKTDVKNSDEEAAAELKENFGDVPLEECAIMCDACWEEVRPRGRLPLNVDAFSAALKAAKKAVRKEARRKVKLRRPRIISEAKVIEGMELFRRLCEDEVRSALGINRRV